MPEPEPSQNVAVVTGGGGDLGRAIALMLASHGAAVVVNDVNSASGESVAEEILAGGGRAIASDADVRDGGAIAAMVQRAERELGAVDILVNNAAIWSKHTNRRSLFVDSEESIWRDILSVNVIGTFQCTRAVLPGMIANRAGKIISIGSVAGVCGLPEMVDYSASKGAIIAFTKALAIEVGPLNIQVNCVSPGSPDMGEGAPPTLLGRGGRPDEFAELVLFLASSRSGFITGHNHVIDGGRVLSTRW